MRKMESNDLLLRDTGPHSSDFLGSAARSLGKVIAIITVVIAALVTFTDVAISTATSDTYIGTLTVMIISAYIMYFSLEDVGEDRGERCEEYKRAKAHYTATRVEIKGNNMPALRKFCVEYSKRELEYRRRNKLMFYGLCEADKPKEKTRENRQRRRIFKKVERMHCAPLTPRMLLSEDTKSTGELCDPERGKRMRSFVKLIPSAVCMCVTVSVALSVKDGMTAADVINGILKLSALPIIGIRGYVSGILFASRTKTAWLETKARILESFQDSLKKEQSSAPLSE